MLSGEIRDKILTAQRNEITEHFIYRKLAESAREENKGVLLKISEDELRHYEFWKKNTGEVDL